MASLANIWPIIYDIDMPTDSNAVTMNVSLPQPLKRYVDGKVSSGVYGSASEFVREVIREKFERDRDREQARQMLAAKLLQGLDGKPIPFTKAHFRRKKAALARRVGRSGSH
jgi:antitoxin ParD1/3/4